MPDGVGPEALPLLLTRDGALGKKPLLCQRWSPPDLFFSLLMGYFTISSHI